MSINVDAVEPEGLLKESYHVAGINERVRIRQVPGDGNCLFYAFGAALWFERFGEHPAYGDEDFRIFTEDLRKQAVDALEDEGRTAFRLEGREWATRGQLLGSVSSQYKVTAEEYCLWMRTNRTWGGGPEIIALCNVFERPVFIYEVEYAPRYFEQRAAKEDVVDKGRLAGAEKRGGETSESTSSASDSRERRKSPTHVPKPSKRGRSNHTVPNPVELTHAMPVGHGTAFSSSSNSNSSSSSGGEHHESFNFSYSTSRPPALRETPAGLIRASTYYEPATEQREGVFSREGVVDVQKAGAEGYVAPASPRSLGTPYGMPTTTPDETSGISKPMTLETGRPLQRVATAPPPSTSSSMALSQGVPCPHCGCSRHSQVQRHSSDGSTTASVSDGDHNSKLNSSFSPAKRKWLIDDVVTQRMPDAPLNSKFVIVPRANFGWPDFGGREALHILFVNSGFPCMEANEKGVLPAADHFVVLFFVKPPTQISPPELMTVKPLKPRRVLQAEKEERRSSR